MFRFFRWGVGALTIAVILTSLVCGAFGMSFQMAESMDHGAVAVCDDGMCATDDAGCLEHCLSRTDAAEERLVIAPATMIVREVLSPTFITSLQQSGVRIVAVPPWQSHRLFAFRE
jgi:hypothetical protein